MTLSDIVSLQLRSNVRWQKALAWTLCLRVCSQLLSSLVTQLYENYLSNENYCLFKCDFFLGTLYFIYGHQHVFINCMLRNWWSGSSAHRYKHTLNVDLSHTSRAGVLNIGLSLNLRRCNDTKHCPSVVHVHPPRDSAAIVTTGLSVCPRHSAAVISTGLMVPSPKSQS